ncbi:unnamed protein product [Closterium sp. Naga37s-1]|nr:unnamed protein product [Closterium sp. Naga37s-1]
MEQIISQPTRRAQGTRDGQCERGEGAAAVEGQSNEVEVLRRMVERNPDAIRFQLEVDIGKVRIRTLEEQVQACISEANKLLALEHLNKALREELQEALDKLEMQRGQGEVLQREKEELRVKCVRMEEQAQVQCGVAEAKVGMLLQQVAASQQAELALKMQAVEQDGERAALARELSACQAAQARSAAEIERIVAERDRFAGEAAQLRVERVLMQKQMEALVGEKARAEERAADATAAGREEERELEGQRTALEETVEEMKRMEVEMENVGKENEGVLEEQRRAPEEAIDGMKEVEMKEVERQGLELLWAAVEQGAGNSGAEGDGAVAPNVGGGGDDGVETCHQFKMPYAFGGTYLTVTWDVAMTLNRGQWLAGAVIEWFGL